MKENKIIDFTKKRSEKQLKKFTKVKPIKELTPEEMESTAEVIKRKEYED